MPDPRRAAAPALLVLVIAGCLQASPTPSASASPPASALPTATPGGSASGGPTASGEPTATPEPPLSLEIPGRHDRRQVALRVEPDVPPDGDGEIVVTVTNLTDRRVG